MHAFRLWPKSVLLIPRLQLLYLQLTDRDYSWIDIRRKGHRRDTKYSPGKSCNSSHLWCFHLLHKYSSCETFFFPTLLSCPCNSVSHSISFGPSSLLLHCCLTLQVVHHRAPSPCMKRQPQTPSMPNRSSCAASGLQSRRQSQGYGIEPSGSKRSRRRECRVHSEPKYTRSPKKKNKIARACQITWEFRRFSRR